MINDIDANNLPCQEGMALSNKARDIAWDLLSDNEREDYERRAREAKAEKAESKKAAKERQKNKLDVPPPTAEEYAVYAFLSFALSFWLILMYRNLWTCTVYMSKFFDELVDKTGHIYIVTCVGPNEHGKIQAEE